ncbi:hypothetical protein M0805_001839 [Coniferiporia weirii]|nr:hypothetical protein M0805_001839 [Coniferiporia weirii]
MSTNNAQTLSDRTLRDHLDPSQLNCLNEATEHPLRGVLAKGVAPSVSYLESDVDEQLLLNVHFNQSVRVRSIVIHVKEENLSYAPKSIKLFINRPSIGFEDVEDASDAETAQVLELMESDVRQNNPIVLRYVKFQKVNSLHIFVASNQGDESTTRIDGIDFFGSVNESTRDLSGLNAQDED